MKTITATVEEAGKLVLISPDLRPGARVQVTIESPEENATEDSATLNTLFASIRRRMEEHPEQFRTPEQIDADIKSEREAWG